MYAPRMQASAMVKWLAWLSAVILVLQLLGATQHHHDSKRHHADCVSCVLAAQLQAPPGDPLIAEQLVRVAVLQYVLPAQNVDAFLRGADKPVPRAQGPPAIFTA